MRKEFLQQLQQPGNQYRPIPFWSWNERLDLDETRRQIAEMQRVGIGGYFMHARGGLQTPFLGEEWMQNIEVGIDEARQRGMGAWAYDENGWPSGFGDGTVNGLGERYQQKYLRFERVEAVTQRQDGRTIVCVADGAGAFWHCYYEVNPFYVDNLDAGVTREFLERSYAPYAKRFAAAFGGAMPGFFTDEPQLSRNGIPWSLTLPAEYQAAYGENLLPLLPELFVETGTYRQTRYRFWHLVQELFVTHFTQQIYDWCEAHGAKLTGHMVLEDDLQSQLTTNAAVMPHYEFFHMPGMDWLCRYISCANIPLQVTSVANQLGRKQVLSETFALSGWSISFEDLKWLYEWQLVRGITQLCQHLEGYSLRGIRKRDHPPSLFYQQPWWDDYRYFNDAMSRIGMLLAKGEVAFDVLMLHPQSSAWLCYNDKDNPGLGDLNQDFKKVTNSFEASHVPFHYGDERILKRHGRVEGAKLVVGQQRYQVVVVPPVDTLDATTVSLLQAFADQGGTLIWFGRQPEFLEGKASPLLTSLCARGLRVSSAAELIAALPSSARPISITDAQGNEIGPIAATWRCLDASLTGLPCRFYYFANQHTGEGFPATIRVLGKSAALFDMATGEFSAIPYTVQGDQVVVSHTIPCRGSCVLFTADSPDAFPAAPVVKENRRPLSAESLKDGWSLELLEPNALTLDYFDFWFDGKLQKENEHVSVIQQRAIALERPVEITLRKVVQVAPDYTPAGELYLVVEMPQRYRITLNGAPVELIDRGFYRDTSFRKLDIRGRLRPGANELILHTTFTQSDEVYAHLRRAAQFESERNNLSLDCEIEAIYLVGGFGVATHGKWETLPWQATRYQGDFIISPLPQRVALDDLTPQGLPFFAGTVRLTKTLTLEAADIAQRSMGFTEKTVNSVAIVVNGAPVTTWFWRPYVADLDGLLKAGENTLSLTLTGTLRNLLGPHHMAEGESFAVGPNAFAKEPNVWGCQPWNDDYCFTEFGLRGGSVI